MDMIVQAVESLLMLAAFVRVVKYIAVRPTQGSSSGGAGMDFGVQLHAVQGQLFLAAGALAWLGRFDYRALRRSATCGFAVRDLR